jgi:hypothetical protein
MPYIKKSDRTLVLDYAVERLALAIEKQDIAYMSMDGNAWDTLEMKAEREINPGVLNYAITLLIHTLLTNKGLSYKRLSMLGGVLSDIRDEYYRTVVAPYEDKKRRENGGVSLLDKITLEDVR